jgi:hypothetical protein
LEIEKLDKYSVLKIDLDLDIRQDWLAKWILSRIRIIEDTGNKVLQVICRYSSRRGFHIWFHLRYGIDYDQKEYLQFMCGDDFSRVWFHRQRRGFKNRRYFDLLFSDKVRLLEKVDESNHAKIK